MSGLSALLLRCGGRFIFASEGHVFGHVTGDGLGPKLLKVSLAAGQGGGIEIWCSGCPRWRVTGLAR